MVVSKKCLLVAGLEGKECVTGDTSRGAGAGAGGYSPAKGAAPSLQQQQQQQTMKKGLAIGGVHAARCTPRKAGFCVAEEQWALRHRDSRRHLGRDEKTLPCFTFVSETKT